MKTSFILLRSIFFKSAYLVALLLFCGSTYAQTWLPAGSGMNISGSNSISALAAYNGELYAGGAFDSADGAPASKIAKWNGTAWSAVGTGMNSFVLALAVYNNELYAAGFFTMAGGNPANYI